MGKLKALYHGQEIASLLLEGTAEYIIGRGSNCSIQLPNEKGVSRQHFRVYDNGQNWVIELLSKTGHLLLEGEKVTSIDLTEDLRFSVPPFEFVYDSAASTASVSEAPVDEAPSDDDAFEQIQISQKIDSEEIETDPNDDFSNAKLEAEVSDPGTLSQIDNLMPEEDTPADLMQEDELSEVGEIDDLLDDEATVAGAVSLMPVLKIKNEKSGEEYSLKLDGRAWIAGRTPDCEIHIEESAISRKHFEIELLGKSYSIKDLGSSNGTHLNGKSLEPHEIYEISSGDKISIRHITITFEVRDQNFDQKMANIKEIAIADPEVSHVGEATKDPMAAALAVYQGPAVVKMESPEDIGFLANPKVKKALMFGAPALLVFALLFGGGESEQKKDQGSTTASEKTISKEDQDSAEHLLGMARGHYEKGNFSFCLAQLEKLHEIVPSFQESKEIESLCRQAIELEKEQADRAAQEQRREEAIARIQTIIDNCEAQKTEATTAAEMQICLQPALELSPEEPRAQALISEIAQREAAQQNAAQQQQAREARIRAGKNAYNRAKSLEKTDPKEAKSQYLKFINGGYGLTTEEGLARRAIASIDKKITAAVQNAVLNCERLSSESKFKEAMSNCNKALQIDSKNSKAIAAKKALNKKVRISMKKIWDNSVLEESFGNIEAAKARWAEIKEKSFPREDYYEKARNKLKQYGIE